MISSNVANLRTALLVPSAVLEALPVLLLNSRWIRAIPRAVLCRQHLFLAFLFCKASASVELVRAKDSGKLGLAAVASSAAARA